MAKFFNKFRKFLPEKYREAPVVIPAVRLSGAIMAQKGGIGSGPTLSIDSASGPLERAFRFKEAPAVAIVINSPGGSPVQANLIYKRIRALAEEHEKKVLVFVEDAAASGGYMIAVAGDEIIADPSSIVGSIGVIYAGFGFVGLIEKLGVDRRVYTAGKNKLTLDPFQPVKEGDVDYIKDIQEDIHETFIDMVKARRGDIITGDEEEIYSGRFWTGKKGQEIGLVDHIGDIRSTLEERYGEKTRIKLIGQKRNMLGRPVGSGVSLMDRFADAVLERFEAKAIWSRLGL